MFVGLADVAGAGVAMRGGVEVFAARAGRPVVAPAVPRLDHVAAADGYADGWTFVAPVVEMPVYLRGSPSRVEELGGTITRMNLPALPVGRDVVVNCAGLGARLLAVGPSVVPVRGQVVYVEQVGLEHWWLDSSADLTYVVPRAHDIVVGGTDDEGDWSRTPVARDGRGDPRARAGGWCPSWPGPGCCGTRSACGRRGRRSASSGRATSCTATATAGPGSRLSWGTADEVAVGAGRGSRTQASRSGSRVADRPAEALIGP